MKNTTTQVSSNKRNIENISIDDFVSGLDIKCAQIEEYIKNKKKKCKFHNDISYPSETWKPSAYLSLLNKKLLAIPQEESKSLDDITKHRLTELYQRFFALRQEVESLDNAGEKICEKVREILHNNYSFENFTHFEQFSSYLDNNNSESPHWNTPMLNRFLKCIYNEIEESKNLKICISRLFHIPWVKKCTWTNNMIRDFWDALRKLKGNQKVELRNLFLSLPEIEKISWEEKYTGAWKNISSQASLRTSGIKSPAQVVIEQW